jgi:NADH dehydrogenase
MSTQELQVVTGAFGYSGRYIAERLRAEGIRVRTLTHRPRPAASPIEVRPLDFGAPEQLAESLRGARVLYNTYWVRFNYRGFSHAQAVENTLRLFEAARKAGVERVVHISIANPSEDSPFEYFRGKARLERALRETMPSWAVLRPALLFGGEDILINNIAWMLRRLPVFGVFGDGQYRLQPIHVEDLARLAVEQARGAQNGIVNAIGPETYAFRDLVRMILQALGKRRLIVSVPPRLGYLATKVAGLLLGDVILTWEEVGALMANLLCVDAPPAGTIRLSDWVREHASELGRHYASELARRR